MKEQRLQKRHGWRILCCSAFLSMFSFVLLVPNVYAQQARWNTEFFPKMTLSGEPAVMRTDKAIDFNWRTGSPDIGVPADGFSARWTRNEWMAGCCAVATKS